MMSSTSLSDLFDAALHIEVGFTHFVVLAFQDLLEGSHSVGDGNLLARHAGENFRHTEWLAEEPLDLARTEYGELVIGGNLIHAENRDDVLQVLVTLQHTLNSASNFVVLLANDVRCQGP